MTASVDEIGEPTAARTERSIRWRGIATSLVLHLLLLAALFGWWQPSAPPEPTLPVVRVVFEGPGAAGRAGGSGGTEAGQGDATKSAAAALADAEALPAPAEAPEASVPPAIEPSPPAPDATVTSTVAPVPQSAAAPFAESQVPPPLPQRKPPRPVVRPSPAPAAPPVPAVAAPLPQPPAPAAAAVVPAPEGPSASAAAPGHGDGADTGNGLGQGIAGAGRGAVGDGPIEGPGDAYLDQLRRWLARYKRYPQEAIERKVEGKVIVGFTLRRDGTVLEAWIERSSGVKMLDDAALAMLQRASPVPPVPARYTGTELKLAMPVDYSIGFFDKLFR